MMGLGGYYWNMQSFLLLGDNVFLLDLDVVLFLLYVTFGLILVYLDYILVHQDMIQTHLLRNKLRATSPNLSKSELLGKVSVNLLAD